MIRAVVYLAIQAIKFDRWPARTVFCRQIIHLRHSPDSGGNTVSGRSGMASAHSAPGRVGGCFSLLLPAPQFSQPKPPFPFPLTSLRVLVSASLLHGLSGSAAGHTCRRMGSPCLGQARKLCLTLQNTQPLGTKNSPCPHKAGYIFVCKLHTLLKLNFFHRWSSATQTSPAGGFPLAAQSG